MKKYHSLIEECLEGECPAGKWCLLREIVIASRKLEPRFLSQMKCVEIHMLNMGKKLHRKVEWDEALFEWNTAYAKRFDEVYRQDPDRNPVKMYEEVTR